MSMTTFSVQGKTFTCRTVAAIVHGSRVLLHRAADDQFWSLPGGRCELMESSLDAVKREMREEIGVDVNVERLLWAAEVFFTAGDRQYHELDFIYLCTLPHNCPLIAATSFSGDEEGLPLIFKWFDCNDLEGQELYPAFLRRELRQLPQHPVHIIARENDQ